jgi:hypothetical protein
MRRCLIVAIAGVGLAFAAATGCSSFEEAPLDTTEGGADGGSGSDAPGSADVIGSGEGGGCNGRVGPSLCAGDPCNLALRINTCCLPADGGATFCSTTTFANCPGAQQNCASSDDCQPGKQCCQRGSTPGASDCTTSCGTAPVLCAKNSECGVGEFCVPPTGNQPYWHCGPCTL